MGKREASPPKIASAKKAKKSGKDGATASYRILRATASQHALGIQDVDRATVQGLACMANKRSFDTTLLNMKKEGLLSYETTTMRLTELGREKSAQRL